MDLTEGNIPHHLKTIAIPASIAFLFNTLFNVVDTFFAGWVSTNAQAALTLSFPVFFIVVAIIQGVSTSTAALIGNALGEQDNRKISLFKAQALLFGFILSIFISIVGFYSAKSLFLLMRAHGEPLHLATNYMQAIFLASFFPVTSYAFHGIFIAYGEARPLRNWLIAASIINAFLNPLLIFGGFGLPALGFQGIAFATIISFILGTFYMGYKLVKERYIGDVKFTDFYPNFGILKELASQIIPSSLNMMAIAIGVFVVTGFVQIFGDKAVASYGIGTRIQQLFLLPIIGLSTAAIAIIGQNNGAKKFNRIDEVVRLALLWSAPLLLLGFFIMLFSPEALMKIFTKDHEVIEYGSLFLRIGAFTSWAYSGLIIFTSALQGLKRAPLSLIIGIIRQVIFPILLIPFTLKIAGGGLNTIWLTTLGINTFVLLLAWLIFKNVMNLERKELEEEKARHHAKEEGF
ncbi:MATE family efflux transporter [Criblamydia sequanensis]|uniref:Multidrug-efflux transporter n=1 Tax=Candidatus Criblamydia sequanensis CRIB-18 TaxID=1437425 RepID=A0A090D2H3_9BACT|nr:MATE family efflux transporter [Criblamydia sequanensis]CDR34645.1 MATE efflux family protein [Criblamydia sequanensis CRIB-18]